MSFYCVYNKEYICDIRSCGIDTVCNCREVCRDPKKLPDPLKIAQATIAQRDAEIAQLRDKLYWLEVWEATEEAGDAVRANRTLLMREAIHELCDERLQERKHAARRAEAECTQLREAMATARRESWIAGRDAAQVALDAGGNEVRAEYDAITEHYGRGAGVCGDIGVGKLWENASKRIRALAPPADADG